MNDLKWECEICGKILLKSYVCQYNIDKHMKTHKLDFYCLQCGKIVYHNQNKFSSKFCNQHCSSIYNNLHGQKRINFCKFCGVKLVKSQKKYCSFACQAAYKWKNITTSIDISDKLPCGMGIRTLKKYLIERRGNKCEICGIDKYMEKPLIFILDHIDGNYKNNMLDNVRLLCSNCDSQLNTYKGKNRGNGRYSRRERYKDGKSY